MVSMKIKGGELSLQPSDDENVGVIESAYERAIHKKKYAKKKTIHQCAFSSIQSDKPYQFQRDKESSINIDRSNMLFNTRKKVSSAVKKERLKPYVRSMVPYMTTEQRAYWRQLYAQLLISKVYEYNFHLALNRKQLLAPMVDELDYYVEQLKYIDSFAQENAPSKKNFWRSNDEHLTLRVGTFSNYAKEWGEEQANDWSDAPNVAARAWMDELNWHRLYWVWTGGGGGFLGSILDLAPIKDWIGRDLASERLESPGQYCGYASWGLYGTRFSFHFMMMLKHTILYPFMTEEEKDVDFSTRFWTQSDQRKHRMLNDIAWGYVNYASMFWYTNSISPFMGAIGGLINVLLMMFDLYMANKKLTEQTERYTNAKNAITGKIKRISLADPTESTQRLLLSLNEELTILEVNWKYEQEELRFIRLLALLFIPAMALMFAPVVPVFIPTLVISAALMSQLVFVGCLMSVVLTAYETFYCAQLEQEKSKELMNGVFYKMALVEKRHHELAYSFEMLTKEERKEQDNELRLCHLEHKRLMLECEHTKAEQAHLNTKTMHSIIVQLAFPVVVFSSLFMALTPAILCIVSALMIALARSLVINSQAPKAIDEFATTRGEGKLVCLTEQEDKKPATKLFFLKGYTSSLSRKNNETKKILPLASLDKHGLFSTSQKQSQNALIDTGYQASIKSA